MDLSRYRRIATLALPIVGGMVSQNVLNLVDTAMVGVLGDAALAAVGLGGFATFMCQALILGISSGVQAMASRRKGEGKIEETAHPLNAGLCLVVLVAIPLSALLFFGIPDGYPLLNDDPEVIALGVPYLQVRVLAIVFVGINFAFRGYWNAVDLSKIYMRTLLVMHSSNILLNYVLIFGKFGFPELGVTGAGIGTSLSTLIGTAYYIATAWRIIRPNGFLSGGLTRTTISTLVRLSLPNGIQQLFFASGFTALYWIIGQVGTKDLAAANVLINIMLVAILPGIALGLTAATLVGQALGKSDRDDAMRWGLDTVKVGMVCIGLLGLPMLIFPETILSIFIHAPDTLATARLPMMVSGVTMSLEAAGLILMNALLGAGDAKRVMIVSIFLQWGLFLPAAYLLGPVLSYGLLFIWIAQGGYRILQTIVFYVFWRRGAWAHIQV